MTKIVSQVQVGKWVLLSLDGAFPNTKWTKAIIDGIEYRAEVVHDIENSVGILATGGNFIGKEIAFD